MYSEFISVNNVVSHGIPLVYQPALGCPAEILMCGRHLLASMVLLLYRFTVDSHAQTGVVSVLICWCWHLDNYLSIRQEAHAAALHRSSA